MTIEVVMAGREPNFGSLMAQRKRVISTDRIAAIHENHPRPYLKLAARPAGGRIHHEFFGWVKLGKRSKGSCSQNKVSLAVGQALQ